MLHSLFSWAAPIFRYACAVEKANVKLSKRATFVKLTTCRAAYHTNYTMPHTVCMVFRHGSDKIRG